MQNYITVFDVLNKKIGFGVPVTSDAPRSYVKILIIVVIALVLLILILISLFHNATLCKEIHNLVLGA